MGSNQVCVLSFFRFLLILPISGTLPFSPFSAVCLSPPQHGSHCTAIPARPLTSQDTNKCLGLHLVNPWPPPPPLSLSDSVNTTCTLFPPLCEPYARSSSLSSPSAPLPHLPLNFRYCTSGGPWARHLSFISIRLSLSLFGCYLSLNRGFLIASQPVWSPWVDWLTAWLGALPWVAFPPPVCTRWASVNVCVFQRPRTGFLARYTVRSIYRRWFQWLVKYLTTFKYLILRSRMVGKIIDDIAKTIVSDH